MTSTTMTDLRFRANQVLKKADGPVWIFSRGKKVGVILNAVFGEQVLRNWDEKGRKQIKKKVPFLKLAKRYRFKGPKDLSSHIDDALYG
ncbi:MAG: hypothetical protein U1C97_01675 [Candidatus Gracilibacteria bacterium]|nr:hypothetical protein [bacterium]MDZ4217011.1 hypothetical protein [Candidatus Gracilibacteria bacterium]